MLDLLRSLALLSTSSLSYNKRRLFDCPPISPYNSVLSFRPWAPFLRPPLLSSVLYFCLPILSYNSVTNFCPPLLSFTSNLYFYPPNVSTPVLYICLPLQFSISINFFCFSLNFLLLEQTKIFNKFTESKSLYCLSLKAATCTKVGTM